MSESLWVDSRKQYPTGKPSEAYISLKDARQLERRLRLVIEYNTILSDALKDMIAVAQAQAWDNAEIHNAIAVIEADKEFLNKPKLYG